MAQIPECRLLEDATRKLIDWQNAIMDNAETEFDAARQIVQRLGAHYVDGVAEIGFWAPELVENEIPAQQIFLEILNPTESIDFQQAAQQITFDRQRIHLRQNGEFLWGVVEGMIPGRRDQVGSFYHLVYRDRDGNWRTINDVLAHSLPFGAFAPAEFYDMPGMFAQRGDAAHFQNLSTQPDPDGVQRITEPTNILQIHARYASEEGTLAGLTRLYKGIADKIQQDIPLTPAEENFIGYDAIQLMPLEPTIEYEGKRTFWRVTDETDETVTTALNLPDMTNWGYDVVVTGSAATNPALLGSKRPDELLDLIVALHNFPGKPIMFIPDIVYGHIDNQALPLMNRHFFAGANMYGQNVNFLHPVVRAILLEMQRRKHDYGVDGVRVDGAQDFKNWDPESDTLWHDDDYLHLMNDVEQHVAGVRYRPWMIFEDGRPWPRDDWELASTYREVTRKMPNVWQWGPLTFAHNTPFLFTFWMQKWWRIREMADIGREWITGCANHDTLRRGTQIPLDARINTYLGKTLPEIIRKAYDNPAARLFDYAMMPGIPMDFLNATMRAPWGFIRNTDDRYGVKVVSEESLWMVWMIEPVDYQREGMFTRLKAMGFHDLAELRRFLRTLDHVVRATDYYLEEMSMLMNAMQPPFEIAPVNVQMLKDIARAFMDDVHDACNVTQYTERLDPMQTDFNLTARDFRRSRHWLMENLREDELLDYLHPTTGSVVFYGLRQSPDDSEQLLFLANMEGAPRTVNPAQLPVPGLAQEGWQIALSTPDITIEGFNAPLTLHDSQGVVFTRQL